MQRGGKDPNPLDFGKKIIPPDHQAMMTKVTRGLLAEQNKHLQLTLVKDLDSVLKHHKKQLENSLDGDPLTQHIPKTIKTTFVSSMLMKQKAEFQERNDKKTTRPLRRYVRLKKDVQRKVVKEQIETSFVTDMPLRVMGVSLLEKIIEGVGVLIPVGQSSLGGEYTTSMAYALYLRVLATDRELFQKLLAGFLFYLKESALSREDAQGKRCALGKDLPLVSVTDAFLLREKRPSMIPSDPWADGQIALALIEALRLWPDLECTDPIRSPAGEFMEVKLCDLTKVVVSSYLNHYGAAQSVLSFDPMVFVEIVNFLSTDTTPCTYSGALSYFSVEPYRADELYEMAKRGSKSSWEGAYAAWLEGQPIAFSLLLSMGHYLFEEIKRGGDLLGVVHRESSATAWLHAMVEKLFAVGGWQQALEEPQELSFTKREEVERIFDLSQALLQPEQSLLGGGIMGPLSVALSALKKGGALPSATSEKILESIVKAQEHYAKIGSQELYQEKRAKVAFGNRWQEDLFPSTAWAQLAGLILKRYQ